MTRSILLALGMIAFAAPALAEIAVRDAYARASMPGAPTGAVFMVIENAGTSDDRLVGVRSDVAARAELHTHRMESNGVMRMVAVEDGFVVPAGGSHTLARGGDHVMLLGLSRSLAQGDTIALTLEFEDAGAIVVDVPVDLAR